MPRTILQDLSPGRPLSPTKEILLGALKGGKIDGEEVTMNITEKGLRFISPDGALIDIPGFDFNLKDLSPYDSLAVVPGENGFSFQINGKDGRTVELSGFPLEELRNLTQIKEVIKHNYLVEAAGIERALGQNANADSLERILEQDQKEQRERSNKETEDLIFGRWVEEWSPEKMIDELYGNPEEEKILGVKIGMPEEAKQKFLKWHAAQPGLAPLPEAPIAPIAAGSEIRASEVKPTALEAGVNAPMQGGGREVATRRPTVLGKENHKLQSSMGRAFDFLDNAAAANIAPVVPALATPGLPVAPKMSLPKINVAGAVHKPVSKPRMGR